MHFKNEKSFNSERSELMISEKEITPSISNAAQSDRTGESFQQPDRFDNQGLLAIEEVTDRAKLSEIENLLILGYRESMAADGFEFSNSSAFLESLNTIMDNGGKVFTACIDGQLVGTISYLETDLDTWYYRGKAAILKHLSIHPQYRGRGFGTGMMLKGLETAAQNNRAVILATPDKNQKAIRLYEKLGFQIITLFFSQSHYSVRMIHWNGQPEKSRELCREGLRKTALYSLIKHWTVGEELASVDVRAEWEKEFKPYLIGLPPETWEMMARVYSVRGATPEEYVRFGFAEMTPAQRATYITKMMLERLNARCSADKDTSSVIRDRYSLALRLADYTRRQVSRPASEGELREFLSAHPICVAKPLRVNGKQKPFFIRTDDLDDQTETGAEQHQISAAGMPNLKGFYLEESVTPDDSMQHVAAGYQAKVMILTFRIAGEVLPLCPLLRLRRANRKSADSRLFDCYASVRKTDGTVNSAVFANYATKNAARDAKLPVKLINRKLPAWEELLSTVTAAAMVLPERTLYGWIMVYTPEGWAVDDVLFKPTLTRYQIARGCGVKRAVEKIIGTGLTISLE